MYRIKNEASDWDNDLDKAVGDGKERILVSTFSIKGSSEMVLIKHVDQIKK